MLSTSAPTPFDIPFGNSAGTGYIRPIPVASQIGVLAGAASLTDGFPPLTFMDESVGGVPPSGQDVNGILYEATAAIQWIQVGGQPVYDSAFSIAIGGYPQGAILRASDNTGWWSSTADNNTTDPDTGGAGWVPYAFSGVTAITMTNASVTLTAIQGSRPIIEITGTLTGNLNLVLPTRAQSWIISNLTSGAHTITAKTAAGTGIPLIQGYQVVWCDATNIFPANTLGTAAQLNASSIRPGFGVSAIYQYAGDTPEQHVAGTAGVDGVSPPDLCISTDLRRSFYCYRSGNASSDPATCALWAPFPPDATEVIWGVAPIATDAQVVAGTDTGSIVTPAKMLYAAKNYSAKSIPVAGDKVNILDSAASYAVKNATLGSIISAAPGFYSNMIVTVTSATAITITSDALVLKDGSGNYKTLSSVSQSIATGTSGAGGLDTGSLASSTWYYPYIIAKPDMTTSAIISASSTAPTLPSGYTFYARTGSVYRTTASNGLVATIARNGRAHYVVGGANCTGLPIIASGAQGTFSYTTPTWVTASLSGLSPPTASKVGVVVANNYTNGSNVNICIAPTNSYSGINSSNPPLYGTGISNSQSVYLSIPLQAASIAVATAGAAGAVFINDWEENL